MMHYLYQIGIAWLLLLLVHSIANMVLLTMEGWIDNEEPYYNPLQKNSGMLDILQSMFTFFIDINEDDSDKIKRVKKVLHLIDRIIIYVFLLAVAAGLMLAIMEMYRRS